MWAAPSLRGVTLARLARFFLTFLFSFSTKLLSFPFFSFHFFVSCCFLAVTQCPSGCETLGKPNAIAAAGAGPASDSQGIHCGLGVAGVSDRGPIEPETENFSHFHSSSMPRILRSRLIYAMKFGSLHRKTLRLPEARF